MSYPVPPPPSLPFCISPTFCVLCSLPLSPPFLILSPTSSSLPLPLSPSLPLPPFLSLPKSSFFFPLPLLLPTTLLIISLPRFYLLCAIHFVISSTFTMLTYPITFCGDDRSIFTSSSGEVFFLCSRHSFTEWRWFHCLPEWGSNLNPGNRKSL